MERIMKIGNDTTLLKYGGKYYLQYDAGMFAVVLKNLLITEDEAKAILKNPEITDSIILNYQEQGEYGEEVKQ